MSYYSSYSPLARYIYTYTYIRTFIYEQLEHCETHPFHIAGDAWDGPADDGARIIECLIHKHLTTHTGPDRNDNLDLDVLFIYTMVKVQECPCVSTVTLTLTLMFPLYTMLRGH